MKTPRAKYKKGTIVLGQYHSDLVCRMRVLRSFVISYTEFEEDRGVRKYECQPLQRGLETIYPEEGDIYPFTDEGINQMRRAAYRLYKSECNKLHQKWLKQDAKIRRHQARLRIL